MAAESFRSIDASHLIIVFAAGFTDEIEYALTLTFVSSAGSNSKSPSGLRERRTS